MLDWIKENSTAFAVAIVFHVIFFGALFINWQIDKPNKIVMEQGDIIQVTSVDANSYQTEVKKIEQQKQAKRDVEKKRKAEEKRQAQVLEEKRQKKKKWETERRQKEKQKNADDLKRKKALAAKKKKETEKKKAEQEKKRKEAEKKTAEEKRKKEALKRKEKQKKAEQEKQRLKEEKIRQAELRRQEERANAERKRLSKGIVNRHVAMIAQKIERNWRQPLDAPSNLKCKIDIVLLPSGKVLSVKVVDSSGNLSFDSSVETAVRRASPLPVPKDSVIFKQFEVMRLRFEPGS